jgi:hypothetical protein
MLVLAKRRWYARRRARIVEQRRKRAAELRRLVRIGRAVVKLVKAAR